MSLPLSGLTVFELGGSASAPYAGFVLSELGAEVLKVERPESGDDARAWGPPFHDGSAVLFHAFNRNKRSLAVDFRDAGQVAALRRLILDRGDALVQNLRPGLVDTFGLDEASLHRERPDLVYCNLAAYGAAGPLKDEPGYDPILQAFSGIMSITGEESRPPVRVGMSILDITTGIWGALGVLAALLGAKRGKPAATVDVSLLETGLGLMFVQLAGVMAGGAVPGRFGSGHPMIVPNRAFQAQDGWFLMTAGNDRLFARLTALIERPDLLEDARFGTNPSRVEHAATLYGLLDQVFAARPVADWVDRISAAGIPCAPIHSVDQVIAHPQVAATGIIQAAPDGSLSLVGLPLSLDGLRPALGSIGPRLGSDSGLLRGDPVAATRRPTVGSRP